MPGKHRLLPGTLTDVMNWAFSKRGRNANCYWIRPISGLLQLGKKLDVALKSGNRRSIDAAKRAIISFVNRGLAGGYDVELASGRIIHERRGRLEYSAAQSLIEFLTERRNRNAWIHSRKVLQYMWELSQGMSSVPPPWRQ